MTQRGCADLPAEHTRSPDPIDAQVGARIRLHRTAAGLSQNALAQRLGLSFQQVQKYESGRNRVSASVLVKLAEALECSAAQLLVGDHEFEGALDNEWTRWLGIPGAIELLRAFSRIESYETRTSLLSIARGLAPTDLDDR